MANIYVSGNSIDKINKIIKSKDIFKIERLFNSDYTELDDFNSCCGRNINSLETTSENSLETSDNRQIELNVFQQYP